MALKWNGCFIGVGNYFTPDGKIDIDKSLVAPAFDAKRIARAFNTLSPGGSFNILNDEYKSVDRPTRNQIYSILNKSLKKSNPEEPFVFSFSGHGSTRDEKYYLHPSDFQVDISTISSIPLNDILNLIYKHRRGKNLIICDCCRASLEERNIEMDKAINIPHMPLNDNTAIILSCSNGQLSFETSLISKEPAGVFNHFFAQNIYYYLLSDAKQCISLYEIYEHVKVDTSQYISNIIKDQNQIPTFIGGDIHDWVMIDDPLIKINKPKKNINISDSKKTKGDKINKISDQWINNILEETDKLCGVNWHKNAFEARSIFNSIDNKKRDKKNLTHKIYQQILKEIFWILCEKGKSSDREKYVERKHNEIEKHIGIKAGALSTAGLSAYLATTFGSVPLGVITTLVTLTLLKASHRSFCKFAGDYFDS